MHSRSLRHGMAVRRAIFKASSLSHPRHTTQLPYFYILKPRPSIKIYNPHEHHSL
jgi:hypothetical protein